MSDEKIDFSPEGRQRFGNLEPNAKGKFQARWSLTDTAQTDPVQLMLKPVHVIPIVFVPGIMGSNLAHIKTHKPVWLLNSVKDVPVGLAWNWARKDAGERQSILHPKRTKVFTGGAVPKRGIHVRFTEAEYVARGWGEVSEASYHTFLLWLDSKMNGANNPGDWEDFSYTSIGPAVPKGARPSPKKLPPGIPMKMSGLPLQAEPGQLVAPIQSDDLLKRSKSTYPIYAFGYNWLASNTDAASALQTRIEKVIAQNNGGIMKCTQVIVVTHSMGGLVARACSQLPGMAKKIAGVVHGVMPATGAAVAYRRCKVGMKDEDFAAGLVIGSNGPEVTAVFAQAPGALQLLPSEEYGQKWLEVADPSGKIIVSLPKNDPYEEIYLQKDKWWGLIDADWLKPRAGNPISWNEFEVNIGLAQDFHKALYKKYHHNTYVIYGGGPAVCSFAGIRWNFKKGIPPSAHGPESSQVGALKHSDVRTDGSNTIYVGGKTTYQTTYHGDAASVVRTDTSFWEIRCAKYDSPGDGTVPSRSGNAPRLAGGRSILQQFELPGVAHEPAFRDYPALKQVAYYAITKLAALAAEK